MLGKLVVITKGKYKASKGVVINVLNNRIVIRIITSSKRFNKLFTSINNSNLKFITFNN